jgi:transcriptional regulator with XRE-family HTH domain
MIAGNALSKLRQIKGLKQKHLAQKMGVTQQALSKLEQKEMIDKEKFEEVLAALRISMEEWKQLEKLLPPPPVLISKVFRAL